MQIAILGAGNVGSALARRLVVRGHDVTLAFSRERGKLETVARAVGARPAEPRDAVAAAEVVILATPWAVTEAALQSAGDLSGKLLWDCTNPLKPDMTGLMLGTETSGRACGSLAGSAARVVKAIPPFAGSGNRRRADRGRAAEQRPVHGTRRDAACAARLSGRHGYVDRPRSIAQLTSAGDLAITHRNRHGL